MRAANAPSLVRVPHTGTWYRAVKPEFLSTAIATAHTNRATSRYSPATLSTPGFEILYLAENHLVAMFEAEAMFGSPLEPGGVVAHPTVSLVTIPIRVRLGGVVNVSDPSQAALIGTNAQELTGDWRSYKHRSSVTSVTGPTGKAPTQELGEALFGLCSDVQGFITISARLPYYRALVVFPERLRAGRDYVRYTVKTSGSTQTIEIP